MIFNDGVFAAKDLRRLQTAASHIAIRRMRSPGTAYRSSFTAWALPPSAFIALTFTGSGFFLSGAASSR